MARWKLMTAHYLNLVQGAEWEYTEVSNGKHKRYRFVVPRFLDPREPGDWNARWGQRNTSAVIGNEDGEVHVCTPGKGEGSDYEFLGDPTPDMMPIDDEAREISASFFDRWRYKPESAETSFSQSIVDGVRMAIGEAPAAPIQIEGLSEMMAMMAASNKMLAESMAAIAGANSVRRG